ncbi:Branched-chain amino acid transport system permease protein OS=Castellaniella defragrans OX=75697 GN=HNR28_003594 PE=4 SV=1 [Castellaniella defragrans]
MPTRDASDRVATSLAIVPPLTSAHAGAPVLEARGISKHYGGLKANTDIDFTLREGELHGVIGPNGAGKSTFFAMLAGELPTTSGKVYFRGQDITGVGVTAVCQLGMSKSYQINQLFEHLTVRQNVMIPGAGAHARPVSQRFAGGPAL